MTLDELKKIKDVLDECYPDVEYHQWGPSYELAKDRREEALSIIKKEIRNLQGK